MIEKFLKKLGYVPNWKIDKRDNTIKELQEENKRISTFATKLIWSTSDAMHYTAADLLENKHPLSKENSEILTSTSRMFTSIAKQALNEYNTHSILDARQLNILKKFGVEDLKDEPFEQWVQFYWKLIETNDKEKSLKSLKNMI